LGRRVFVRKADCDALIRANTIMPEGAAAQKFSQLSSA
jgi:hypothetical protein